MKSTIILATDGSEFADAAARFIAEGTLLGSDPIVHLVTVATDVPLRMRGYFDKDTIDTWLRDTNVANLVSACKILDDAGIPYEKHLLHGDAAEVIVELAETVGASAVVMGRHGRGSFLDAIVGSVAGKVLARAECPVILIKTDAPTGKESPAKNWKE
ncbi:universal stress protein [Herbaspirillum autotrophicum]|uniref:universal stress protein n=1 Tax=Herbaspirillum autotrophicum TaxID=180195 RepID=UPI00067D2148|nr:universal stress protein [Herbaspirillum autotrophicum]